MLCLKSDNCVAKSIKMKESYVGLNVEHDHTIKSVSRNSITLYSNVEGFVQFVELNYLRLYKVIYLYLLESFF